MNDTALKVAAMGVIEATSGIMLPLEALADNAEIRVNVGAMKRLKAALIGPAGLPPGVSFHKFAKWLRESEGGAVIAEALRILGEHFDVVQLLASVVDDEGVTSLRTKGIGNYYARKGMVQEWQECALAEEIARQISGEDDGETWKKRT